MPRRQLNPQDFYKLALLSLEGAVTNDILIRTANGWQPNTGLPATALAVPALTLGTTNGAGTAVTAIRSDATIALFDATAPTDVDGTAAAAGTAAFAARRNHQHAVGATLTLNATSVVTDATTGLKLGTGTTQKLGVYNATPVAQGAVVADASGGATVDAEARTAINAILARLRAFGIIAT